jgi:hypothetical protein
MQFLTAGMVVDYFSSIAVFVCGGKEAIQGMLNY